MSNSYLADIHQQPQVIARAADAYPERDAGLVRAAERLQANGYGHVVLTGMGSSLYACYPLLLALSRHGIPATMWDASELIHQAPAIITPHTLVVAVSQSGESAEIKGLAALPRRPSLAIAVTNAASSSLARWADVVLDMHAGDEATVATKTYVATLTTLHLLGCQLTQQDVAEARGQLHDTTATLTEFLKQAEPAVAAAFGFLKGGDTLALVGRGESLTTALTGALILQEASKLFATGLSAGQFRHGPLELARPGLRMVVFAGSGAARELNLRLAHDVAAYGAQVLLVSPFPGASQLGGVHELHIPAVADRLLPLIEIVPVQLLSIPLASSRGFAAGVFERGGKVTATE